MKKVLILCASNGCRSILAEALIKQAFGERGVIAYSPGSCPSGRVNLPMPKSPQRAGSLPYLRRYNKV